MKDTRLLHAIGDIDDAYVTEAVRSKARRTLWRRLVAAAACVALILGGMGLYNHFKAPQLPLIHISTDTESGMGREAYLAHSFDELAFHSPWQEEYDLKTLPVYDNSRVAAWYSTYEEVTRTSEEIEAWQTELLRVAGLLGMDTTAPVFEESIYDGQQLSDSHYTIEVDDTRLRIYAPMEEGYTLDPYAPYDDLYRTAQHLLEMYKDVIDMENPCINISLGDYTIENRQQWWVQFYDKVADPTDALLNYTFRQGMFYSDESQQKLVISFDRFDLSTVMGEYPLITVAEAKTALEEGHYVSSTLEPFPGLDTVQKVELTYRNAFWDEVFMPYYKFYVEEPNPQEGIVEQLGMKSYATYYVPAVKSRYIENLPQWDGSING